jgi:hypothetical protein
MTLIFSADSDSEYFEHRADEQNMAFHYLSESGDQTVRVFDCSVMLFLLSRGSLLFQIIELRHPFQALRGRLLVHGNAKLSMNDE